MSKNVNPDSLKSMFKAGAVWAGKCKSRDGQDEKCLNTIDVELVPGTYTVNEGDTLRLIGYLNEYKHGPEGDRDERKPDFRVKLKRMSKED